MMRSGRNGWAARWTMAAVVLAVAFTACLELVHAQGATAAGLSGTWEIDRDASEFPKEIGFNADFLSVPGADVPGGRGRGPGGAAPALRPQGESYDSAQRRDRLTAEVRTPAVRLTIDDQPDVVTLIDERGSTRTFHPDGRSEVLDISGVSVLTNARREGDVLVVSYSVADLRQLRYSYVRIEGRLVVDVQFLERGRGQSVRRAYKAADPRQPATSAPSTTSAGQAPAVPGAPPAAMPRAGSEFAGLTRLGLVVEDLGAQGQACGLTTAGVEAAASKPFTDAGLRVSRNADEDTYVHISIMTSTLPSGMCISRFDWAIYSTTDATLSYQSRPLLVQVLLARKGGMSGNMPAAHGADVMKSLGEGLTQVAGLIRDANR